MVLESAASAMSFGYLLFSMGLKLCGLEADRNSGFGHLLFSMEFKQSVYLILKLISFEHLLFSMISIFIPTSQKLFFFYCESAVHKQKCCVLPIHLKTYIEGVALYCHYIAN